MSKKTKMASRKKIAKKQNRTREFFSALWGFWPVWLVIIIGTSGVVLYRYSLHQSLLQANVEKETVAVKTDSQLQPIKENQIKITGKLRFINEDEIKRVLIDNMTQGYLSSDLNSVREKIIQLPWVESATLRREIPKIIEVKISEKKAILRWRNEGLISDAGLLFFPKELANKSADAHQFEHLPQINVAKDNLQEAIAFLKNVIPVISKLNLQLTSIDEDVLGGWEVHLGQDQKVVFGRKKLNVRILRLSKIWRNASQHGRIQYLDLRYANGGSVHYFENKT